MPTNSYQFKYDKFGKTSEILIYTRGLAVMDNSYTNKGTAFEEQERQRLGLIGMLPPGIRNVQQQVRKNLEVFEKKNSDIEKYIYMRSLFDRNVALAHAMIDSDIERFLPIIYTPTVGLACQQYSSQFRKASGLHFFPGNIDYAEDILRRHLHRQIRVAVVTDNQGILGIGDQGAGGIAICIGKLMLYTLGAGIAPWHCLPISLDVGTDNPMLLGDADYLGWRHERLKGDDYIRFVQRFARAFKAVFPNALCQWEDFSKQNAFAIRDAYLHELISFNDDIQGTGAITLAAILTSMKIKQERLADQVFLVHGAGAGGVGVAEQIGAALLEEGLSRDDARRRIFTVDSRGLVTTDRKLEPYKMSFAKNPGDLPWFNGPEDGTLLNVIRKGEVSVLIGTSGQVGCFTREITEAMLANSPQPVILPLSNPTANTEALPSDLMEWTGGRALVATGSPFAPVTVSGREIQIGQCNNVFVFPGVGLGVIASGANEVLPEFFTAAARAVSAHVTAEEQQSGMLVPKVKRLREISDDVAVAVGKCAIEKGVSRPCVYSSFQHKDDPERLRELIEKMRWSPEYLPLVPM